MSDAHSLSASQKSSLAVGRHDGHASQHLNCVALRHGWSRTFSIPYDEVQHLDYETLGQILEVHTLKLRPLGVRIFVENPADSGTWSKVRPWRDDGSLQSTLVQAFFEGRRNAGVVTRLEVRDGADRTAEGDTLSLHSVASRIFHPQERSTGSSTPKPKPRQSALSRWFGFGSNKRKGLNKAQPQIPDEDQEGEEQELVEAHKPSLFSLLRPSPTEPTHVRRSIFAFFSARQAEPTPEPAPNPEDQKKQEEDIMRKRGWLPPTIRKKNSLRESLKYSQNPFLGGNSRQLAGLTRRKKQSSSKDDNPFADENAGGSAQELTEQDVDDFFEVERPDSMALMDSQEGGEEGKSWSRFKSSKDRKSKKKKGKGKVLGSGADVVATPADAFPKRVEESEVD